MLIAIATAIIAWIGWHAAIGAYTPGRGFGHALGIAGASVMAVLLLYPLRKHVGLLRNWVPLKQWFAMHVVCGIAGPLLVLFHTGFRLRSLNATVAVASMVLVAVSGVVGRFLYRKIHHGLNVARAASQDMQGALARELAQAERVAGPLPAVRLELARFAAVASRPLAGWRARVFHFLAFGFRRALAQRRISGALGQVPLERRSPARAQLASLERASCDALQAMQRIAQFAAYERLFSLWRILHVPLVFMLVISAIVHAMAAHAY